MLLAPKRHLGIIFRSWPLSFSCNLHIHVGDNVKLTMRMKIKIRQISQTQNEIKAQIKKIYKKKFSALFEKLKVHY